LLADWAQCDFSCPNQQRGICFEFKARALGNDGRGPTARVPAASKKVTPRIQLFVDIEDALRLAIDSA
jgi:hypothetical protein